MNTIIDKNIVEYLDKIGNKNHYFINSDITELCLKASYISINQSNPEKLIEILDHIYYYLDNGSILHVSNWYDNISGPKNVYKTFNIWKKGTRYMDFIDFPTINWNEKAFVCIKTDEYDEWSD